jgi:hypothetical protein
MNRRQVLRLWGRAGLGLAAAMMAGPLFKPAQAVLAAPECQSAAWRGAVEPAGPDERLAQLPPPFDSQPWSIDRTGLLREARECVAAELEAIDAPGCFAAQLPSIAERTALLSPFEFLVVGYYKYDLSRRDELLQAYRSDPRQALRQLTEIWPSPRAEMLVTTPAFFDLDADQVFVNTAVVTEDRALNVLAHEFWHALATVRLDQWTDGSQTRTTGFWTEVRPAGGQVWRALEEKTENGVSTYLMNEAVAIEMEVTATGRQHNSLRSDLRQALDTLHELFDAVGSQKVLQLYLESRSSELKTLR